tara:strand:- start:9401 stop:9544 length:144 start_codon:yes stop_codon:yes gene_type:complete
MRYFLQKYTFYIHIFAKKRYKFIQFIPIFAVGAINRIGFITPFKLMA